MERLAKKAQLSQARKDRVRRHIRGTRERPRLAVKRTLKHIMAQVIDDTQGRSLVLVTSWAKDIAQKTQGFKGKAAVSRLVGNLVAEKALALGIKQVVFDRAGLLYHGRVKALADGAREKGLEF